MRKAGGIIALIGGLLGVFAAIFTIVLGGVGSALGTEQGSTIAWLGFGGVAFSFLAIVLGVIAINARRKLPGVLLIVNALAGVVWGGDFVAVCMVLVLIGGILALFRNKPDVAVAQQH